ncbi:MAG: aminotransferase class III-fold pyridoxal phosphate-dependent enzyme [Trueperaceae bacterium]|nr:aminotransferase class III-fold pyridoxal phosphate-dependent enzyme [Trueperaceae bacterium]
MSELAASSTLSPVWTHLTDVRPVRGQGAWLEDDQGHRWLDMTSGIGVTNTGHAHPRVVAAVREQAERLFFGQANIVRLPQADALAERLERVTPPGIDTFFFSNSGAEAVEAAVKLARHATGRSNLIVFQGSFHGRTHQAMAMTTSKTAYRHRYQPLPAGTFVAPFPYALQLGMDQERAIDFALAQLDLLFASQTAPDETAAMVIEPVLGEGGYVPAPARFLAGLRERCDEHGILLALDEVQSGFGRTGAMFAVDHANVRPDVLIMAKGLGSGFPISAIGAPADTMSRWEPGTHGGTYGGGNAVVLAAASATIDVIVDEDLPAAATERGEQLRDGLRRTVGRDGVQAEVRGPGLMVGVELHRDDRPDAELAKHVLRACLDERMLILGCGPAGNVIRWIPPLVATEDDVDQALQRFERAVDRSLTKLGRAT